MAMATSHLPPQLSPQNKLLSSIITLPTNPLIVYATYSYTPSGILPSPAEEYLESARRDLVSNNNGSGSAGVINNLLHCVRIEKEEKCVYVFGITEAERKEEWVGRLRDLKFDNLIASEPSAFTPQELYPCSKLCASQRDPCPSCLSPSPATHTAPSSRLPRVPLRNVYRGLLDAVRDRLVDDVAEASISNGKGKGKDRAGREVKRFKDGFLLGPLNGTGAAAEGEEEWGASWGYQAKMRPLIHCQLSIHLAPTRIIVHPILRPTNYLPLSSSLSPPPYHSQSLPPLQSGIPIILLPYAVPAYFLTTYTGPTAALNSQFSASLSGLGVGAGSWNPGGYVIAWISVQNKLGEEKGMNVIWPTRLCVGYHPSVSASPTSSSEKMSGGVRQPLAYVPTLPAQLQPSPPPPPPPMISLLTSSAPSSPAREQQYPISITQQLLSSSRPGLTRRVATASAIESLKSMNLGKGSGPGKGLGDVAVEVGGYVDSVAKERERERERIRREREGLGASPKLASASVAAGAVKTEAGKPDKVETSPSANATEPASVKDEKEDVEMASPEQQQQSQQSYPSPPITVPPSSAPTKLEETKTQPEASSSKLPGPEDQTSPPEAKSEQEALQRPPTPPPSTDATGTAESNPESEPYDPFGSWTPRPAWNQRPGDDDFMDMDYDMGMSMGRFIDTSGAGGDDAEDNFGDMMFTDDDFSFFDGPSGGSKGPVVGGGSGLLPAANIPASVPAALGPNVGHTSFGFSPPFYGDIGSGPGPPSATPGQPGSSPWVPSALAEGFTPRYDGPPDLISSSPGKTPSSHSMPTTPTVQLSPRSEGSRRPKSRLHLGPSIFDPIPFAVSHRISDGKYASGKFSLPSPPDEEDRTQGWKLKYSAATDFRVGLVRKLIGVKRKGFEQGSREGKMSPSWVREREDWENNNPEDAEVAEKSEESEDDDADMQDSPLDSRPSTPPPSYLPLGPTLLHTQFRHSELLPLSAPLRPPDAAVDPPGSISTAAAAASVPTPVSPAAALGAAAEKSRSLEAAAFTLAKEVVENTVWAKAWRTNVVGIPSSPATEVWQADVGTVVNLLNSVSTSEGPIDIKALYQPDPVTESTPQESLNQLEPPMFTLSKSDAIVQVLPTALRFWTKLGLGPRGGKKNVTAFALFEDDGEEKQHLVEHWLDKMSATYSAFQLGTHSAGECDSLPRQGIVPLKFGTFRKSLASFVASLPVPESSVVFYLVTPSRMMDTRSPLLRQLFAGVKRALKTYSEAQIEFQFVPEDIITNFVEHSALHERDLLYMCHSVYERILQPVDRCMSRKFFEHGERVRNYFQEPVFTIARPVYNKVQFVREAPVRSLDVVDRHTLLHVGYQVSPCGKWIMAACIDQRGESHELGLWLTQTDSVETQIVNQVWEFTLKFARKANVEWRIVIAKLGTMGEGELEAWALQLASTVPNCPELPMMHVFLLVVEANNPWTFISPHHSKRPPISKPSSGKEQLGSFYVDASSATFSVSSISPMPLSTNSRDILSETSFIPDTDDLLPSDTLPILPLSTMTLIHSPADAGYTNISMLHIHILHSIKSPLSSNTISDSETHKDIAHNYHELAVLAKARWRLDSNPVLPLHLGALEVMYMALGTDELD